MRHNLKDGQSWVELRDPKTLTNRERKPFQRSIVGRNLDDTDSILAVGTTACQVMITSWSFPQSLPSENLDALDDLPALAYDEITRLCVDAIDDAFLAVEDPERPPTTPSSG